MKKGKEGHDRRDIDCTDVMRQLFEYLDGEVDTVSHDEIDRHLDGCRSCFSRIEFEKALKERVRRSTRDKAPDSLRQKLDILMEGFAAAGGADGHDREHGDKSAAKNPRKE